MKYLWRYIKAFSVVSSIYYPDFEAESDIDVLLLDHLLEDAVEAAVVVGVPELAGDCCEDDAARCANHECLECGYFKRRALRDREKSFFKIHIAIP